MIRQNSHLAWLMLLVFLATSAFAQDSLNIHSVGFLESWGSSATCVTIQGGTVYVGSSDRIKILSLNNPDQPFDLGRLNSHNVSEIAFHDNLAVIAEQDSGIVMVDFSNPARPFVYGRSNVAGNAVSVVFNGDNALVGSSVGALSVLNMGDPGHPVVMCQLRGLGTIWDIVVRGNYAYLATSLGLYVADITRADSMVYLSRYQMRSGNLPITLALLGNYAYFLQSDSLQIFDVTNPADPQHLSRKELTHTMTDMYADGRYVYLSGSDGIEVLDCWEPNSPDSVTFVPVGWGASKIAKLGSNLWVGDNGLTRVSLVQPRLPVAGLHMGYVDQCFDVAVVGNKACITSPGAVLTMNLENRAAPSFTARTLFPWVFGHYPYVIMSGQEYIANCCNFGIVLARLDGDMIDSVGLCPVLSGHLAAGMIDTSSGRAIVADNAGKVALFDITNIEQPQCLDSTSGWHIPLSVGIKGEWAVLYSDWEQGDDFHLSLFHIDGGQRLRFTNSLTFAHTGVDAKVVMGRDIYLEIGGNIYAIQIVRDGELALTDSTSVGTGVVYDLEVVGNFLVTADGGAISVFDASNPYNLRLSGYYIYPAFGFGHSDSILVAVGEPGIKLLECHAALGVEAKTPVIPIVISLNVFPNPFNSRATIQFTLPSRTNGRLVLIDPLGRVVDELSPQRWMEAGEHRFGLDGSRLPSGAYLLQFNGNGNKLSRPVTILK